MAGTEEDILLALESQYNPAGIDQAITSFTELQASIDAMIASLANIGADSGGIANLATAFGELLVAADDLIIGSQAVRQELATLGPTAAETSVIIQVLADDFTVNARAAMTLSDAFSLLGEVFTTVVTSVSDGDTVFGVAADVLNIFGMSAGNVAQFLFNLDQALIGAASAMANDANIFDAAGLALMQFGVTSGIVVDVLAGLSTAVDFLGNAFGTTAEKAAVADQELRSKGEDANYAGYRLLMLVQIVGMLAVGFIRMGMTAQDAISKISGLADQSLAGASGASKLDSVIKVLEFDSLKFGMTLDQAAKGLYYLISSGMSTANALQFLGTAMEAAKAMGTQFNTVANGLTSIMRVYGLNVAQATAMTNMYVEAVVKGKQDPTLFANAIGGLALSAHSAGISLMELFAAQADLTQMQPRVRMGAQDLSHMFDELATKSSALAGTARGLGGALTDTQFAALPLIDRLKYLAQVAGGDTVAAFRSLGLTQTSARVAFALLSDKGAEYNKILLAMGNSSNALAVAFQESEKNLSASFQHIGAALSILSYQLIIFATPVIKPILDGIAQAIGYIASNANLAIPVFTTLAVIVGGILVVGIGMLLSSLGGLIGVVGAVVLPIALLAGGIALVVKNWGAISSALSSTFPGLKYTGDLIQVIAQYLQGMFSAGVSKAGQLLQQLGGWVSANVLPVLKQLGTHLIEDADYILAKVIPALSSMQSNLAPVGNFIMSVVVPALGQFALWILRAADFVASHFVPIMGAIGAVLGPVISFIVMVGKVIIGTLLPPLQMAWAVVTSMLIPAFQSFISVMAPLMPTLFNIAKAVGGVLVVAFGLLLGIASGVLGALAGMLPGVVLIFTGIVNVILGVVQVIAGILTFIADLFHGNFSKLGADLIALGMGVLKIFAGLFQVIGGIVGAFVGLVLGFFNGFVQGVVGFFTWLYHTIVGGSIIPDFVNGIIHWIQVLIQTPQMIARMVQVMIDRFNYLKDQAIALIITTVTGWIAQVQSWISQAEAKALDLVTRVIVALTTIVAKAKQVIADMIKGMGDAIAAGIAWLVQQATNLANSVAGAIHKILHFSKPEQGPLSDVDTWMPHFGQMLASGLNAQIPMVRAAASLLAFSIAAPFTGSLSGMVRGQSIANMYLKMMVDMMQKQGAGRMSVGNLPPSNTIGAINQTFNNYGGGGQDAQRQYSQMNQLAGRAFEFAERGAWYGYGLG